MEIIYNFLIVTTFIYAVILFLGKKLMYRYLYFYTILNIFIISGPLNTIQGNIGSEEIVFILMMLIIFIPIYVFGFVLRRETYTIENVKNADVIDIITESLSQRNIGHEVKDKEIYLTDYNKYITVRGSYELSVDFKEVRKLEFYKGLKNELWLGIKSIEKRIFPFYGIFYLFMVGVLIWLKGIVV